MKNKKKEEESLYDHIWEPSYWTRLIICKSMITKFSLWIESE